MAKRYQAQALIAEQGGVQTFAGRDAVNGLPVRMYTFMDQPAAKVGEPSSPYIPPVLSSNFTGGAGEVIVAFSPEFRMVRGAVAPGQVEVLLRQTAAALDDAARAGVVHGDLSPERVLFDREAGAGGRFLLEGYGVPWRVKPSEFSAPERIGGASFASDVFSWAMTVRHLSGPLPGPLRDLLSRCLDADPGARPQARAVRAALESYPFGARGPQPSPGVQSARDVSAFELYDSGAYDGDAANDADDFRVTLTPPDERAEAAPQETVQETPPQPVVRPVDEPTVQEPTVQEPTAHEPTQPRRPPVSVPAPPPTPRAVRVVARADDLPETAPEALPADAIRRTDQTSAYEARRARYRAEQSDASDPDPADGPAARTPQGGAARTSRPVRAAPAVVPAPPEDDFAEVFDVVDDIDDRAPDPTLSRGGRRVLLLTLLGIAVLVLIALQLVNA